jgi:hypothetical protein
MNLPVEVIDAVREGRCVVFAGSRCTFEAALDTDKIYPSAKALAVELGWKKPRPRPGTRPGPVTPSVRGGAAVYEADNGRAALVEHLTERVGAGDVAPNKALEAMVLRFPLIFTTAWDDLLERAAAAGGRTVQVVYRGEPIPEIKTDCTIIYKLNGGLERPESLVATPADLAVHPLPPAVQKQLRMMLRKQVVFFVGHRPDEEEFEAVFTDLTDAYGGDLPRCHLAVAQGRIDDYQWQRWVWRGLLLFLADPSECMDALKAKLSG